MLGHLIAEKQYSLPFSIFFCGCKQPNLSTYFVAKESIISERNKNARAVLAVFNNSYS